MKPQIANPRILIFVLAIIALAAVVHIGAISITFSKLGLTRESAFVLLMTSLFGSLINLPLFTVRSKQPITVPKIPLPGVYKRYIESHPGRTLVAINVGGGLIPIFFSVYLFLSQPLALHEILAGISLVTLVSYIYSFPVKGVGIGMPIIIAPVAAAIIAIVINADLSAPLAYISGTMGVLIGADILNFRRIPQLGAMLASIGGAGTFDGIFMTGILAVLLA